MFRGAMLALNEGKPELAISIGEELCASDDEGDRLSGYLCLGYAYEDLEAESGRNLERALGYYRQVSLLTPSPLPFLLMARVSMRVGGDEGFESALRYLQEVEKFGVTPELLLGFAHYYRFGSQKSLKKARDFYLRAATRGRFSGFLGYSDVARELNQKWRARLMDSLRVLLAPLIVVLIGRRAREAFID